MDFDKITHVVVELLKGKYEKPILQNDKDFLRNNIVYMRTQCINDILSKTDHFLHS